MSEGFWSKLSQSPGYFHLLCPIPPVSLGASPLSSLRVESHNSPSLSDQVLGWNPIWSAMTSRADLSSVPAACFLPGGMSVRSSNQTAFLKQSIYFEQKHHRENWSENHKSVCTQASLVRIYHTPNVTLAGPISSDSLCRTHLSLWSSYSAGQPWQLICTITSSSGRVF